VSAAARAELGRHQGDAARLLQAAGWQVVLAGPDQSVEDVWAQLGSSVVRAGAAGARVPA
jgi:hypothetical protein